MRAFLAGPETHHGKARVTFPQESDDRPEILCRPSLRRNSRCRMDADQWPVLEETRGRKGSIGTTRFSDQVLGAKRAAQEHEFLFGDLWKPNDQIDLSQEFSPKPHESPESVIEGLDVKR